MMGCGNFEFLIWVSFILSLFWFSTGFTPADQHLIDCVWCHWVKTYLLKGRSFWRVKIPNDPSWVWRKILSLRPLIFPLIKHIVEDGQSIFLWHDKWHPLGSLWSKFGERIIYVSAIHGDSKVNAVIENNSWKWPSAVTWEIKELIDNTPLSLQPSQVAGRVVWVPAHDGFSNPPRLKMGAAAVKDAGIMWKLGRCYSTVGFFDVNTVLVLFFFFCPSLQAVQRRSYFFWQGWFLISGAGSRLLGWLFILCIVCVRAWAAGAVAATTVADQMLGPKEDGHLAIVLVGLLARGKSFTISKITRYLRCLGHDTKHFDVGKIKSVAGVSILCKERWHLSQTSDSHIL